MKRIVTALNFGKMFLCNMDIQLGDSVTTITRQLFIARTEQINEGQEAINIVTHSLDGKRVVLTLSVPEQNAEVFVTTFPEEEAQKLANKYCLMTLDEINQLSKPESANDSDDLDLTHVGVE